MRQEYPVDFDINLYAENGTLLKTITVTGNNSIAWSQPLDPWVLDVAKQELVIKRWSHEGRQVKILEFFTSIQETYLPGDLVSIKLLEEREASQGSLPVGNVSANEIVLGFNNEDGKFDVDNEQSPLANLLKANRRIRVWLGAEVMKTASSEVDFSSAIITADSEEINSDSSKAFDGDEDTVWRSTSTPYPHWIQVDFGSPKIITKLRIRPWWVSTGAYFGHFIFQGSNDGLTWVDIYEGDYSGTSWAEFDIDNITQYRFYRIYGTANQNKSFPDLMWLREVKMTEMIYSTQLEYVPLGTFWSLDWDSPDDTLEATVTARDRMELLRKNHIRNQPLWVNETSTT
jgi:hypothetical protein